MLIGDQFGRLNVLELLGERAICSCTCGNITSVRAAHLRSEDTQSCGCLSRELSAARSAGKAYRLTHGLSRRGVPRPPELQMWYNARSRSREENIPFNIELSDIVIPEFCPVLGMRLVAGTRKASWNSPSLDKIVPERGYVKGNVAVISRKANLLKSDATPEMLQRVADYARKATCVRE